MLPGDGMWVLNSTSDGFLAAGAGADGNHATQAVIWTSRDGVTWQRKTAAQLGLAGPGETVQSISYITSRGTDTVISGQVSKGGATYAGVWLSTDGGDTWTRVTVPADHGAGTAITGLGSDASGLLAVRPGRSASGTPDAVAYFSPNGTAWQYAGTIGASAGWNPDLVKGSDFGFVVAGASAAGQLVAFTSTGTGGTWQQTGSLGNADTQSVVGATVASAGTIVAVGYTSPSKVSQQPVFLEASAAGSVRPVPLASIPELSVNGLSVAAGQQIAVGSAEGYPAVWRKASGGSWALVTSLSQVSATPGLEALTGVTHGSSGWLAVGAPGPVVMTSADGTTWQPDTGPHSITADLAGVSAVAVAAGPHGYVIVGKLVAPGGSCVADVWWSPNLTFWMRAHDVNDATGSSQVLAVAADARGFVSVGSHNGKPAVWTTTDGPTWRTIVLPVPAGASSAVLQQIAISGNRVAALGQATTPAGTVPIAELSVNGGSSWQQVPFSSPGPDTTFTALTASSGGFTAAGQFGAPGQQQVAAWTSANGTSWTPAPIGGLTGPDGRQLPDQRAGPVRQRGDRYRLARHPSQPGGLHRDPPRPLTAISYRRQSMTPARPQPARVSCAPGPSPDREEADTLKSRLGKIMIGTAVGAGALGVGFGGSIAVASAATSHSSPSSTTSSTTSSLPVVDHGNDGGQGRVCQHGNSLALGLA